MLTPRCSIRSLVVGQRMGLAQQVQMPLLLLLPLLPPLLLPPLLLPPLLLPPLRLKSPRVFRWR